MPPAQNEDHHSSDSDADLMQARLNGLKGIENFFIKLTAWKQHILTLTELARQRGEIPAADTIERKNILLSVKNDLVRCAENVDRGAYDADFERTKAFWKQDIGKDYAKGCGAIEEMCVPRDEVKRQTGDGNGQQNMKLEDEGDRFGGKADRFTEPRGGLSRTGDLFPNRAPSLLPMTPDMGTVRVEVSHADNTPAKRLTEKLAAKLGRSAAPPGRQTTSPESASTPKTQATVSKLLLSAAASAGVPTITAPKDSARKGATASRPVPIMTISGNNESLPVPPAGKLERKATAPTSSPAGTRTTAKVTASNTSAQVNGAGKPNDGKSNAKQEAMQSGHNNATRPKP